MVSVFWAKRLAEGDAEEDLYTTECGPLFDECIRQCGRLTGALRHKDSVPCSHKTAEVDACCSCHDAAD